ncbi:hypothetical protein BC826DRAFT_485089 [Russula brevipes]|nr:hypothetical protein BC826DRAFT_485089 [Russula brevipes]
MLKSSIRGSRTTRCPLIRMSLTAMTSDKHDRDGKDKNRGDDKDKYERDVKDKNRGDDKDKHDRDDKDKYRGDDKDKHDRDDKDKNRGDDKDKHDRDDKDKYRGDDKDKHDRDDKDKNRGDDKDKHDRDDKDKYRGDDKDKHDRDGKDKNRDDDKDRHYRDDKDESYRDGPKSGKCSVGKQTCCNQVQDVHETELHNLSGLLNLEDISDILQFWTFDGKSKVVGKDCSPMMGSNQGCNAQTLCCDDNQTNGLIAVGCANVNLGL